jgi:ribokinase
MAGTPGNWDIVVLGGANTDFLVRGPRLPGPGETLQGELFDEAPGGKGANQAVAAARLGSRVGFVGRIGDDARGAVLLKRLVVEGIGTRYLRRDASAGTGVALVMVDERGEKQIFAVPQANARVGRDDLKAAAPAIRGARVLLVQLEVPIEVVEEAVVLAREAQVKVVLDPAPARPLPERLLRHVDVIRPNAQEAQILTGIQVRDFTSARAAADAFLAQGAGAAIVAAGDEGDLLLSSEGEQRLPHHRVPSVDATGAGDAFAAAIAVALAEGASLLDAARFGSAAAALKTTKVGAQAGLPTREEVLTFLEGQALEPAGARAGEPEGSDSDSG